jgi:tRNA(Phe) wybutosine-synthesizing methylase Tyw3
MRRSGGTSAFSLRDLTPHFHGAAHRIDDASKLKEQAVACGFDYPATMLKAQSSQRVVLSRCGLRA